MGTSTDAQLSYGYKLGGGEEPWAVAEARGEYGELTVSWYDEDSEDDFPDAVETRLLQAAGFTETDWSADGYWERKRAAEERAGVKVDSYCSTSYPIYMLVAHTITVARGELVVMDLDQLKAMPGEQGWDAKLAAALTVLGLTPVQQKPAWLLTSEWGV